MNRKDLATIYCRKFDLLLMDCLQKERVAKNKKLAYRRSEEKMDKLYTEYMSKLQALNN